MPEEPTNTLAILCCAPHLLQNPILDLSLRRRRPAPSLEILEKVGQDSGFLAVLCHNHAVF